MGADMLARTLYLSAHTTIDLTAAKTTASQLSQQATLADLRTLLEYGWIADDTLPDDSGLDAYTTGGLSHGDSPTDAFDDWDIVFDDVRFPMRWPAQLGAAAGLLHPWGDGPSVATVTFRAWN